MEKPKVEVGRWEERDSRDAKPSQESPVAGLDALAWMLDSSIRVPGTKFRIGLDAIIGFVPVVGDLVGTALSSYILIMAAKLGVPRVTLLRMGFNVTLEAVVGLVPFAGDLFDMVWKANKRNVELLKAHLQNPGGARRGDWLFAGLFMVGAVVLMFGLAWAAIAIGRWVTESFSYN